MTKPVEIDLSNIPDAAEIDLSDIPDADQIDLSDIPNETGGSKTPNITMPDIRSATAAAVSPFGVKLPQMPPVDTIRPEVIRPAPTMTDVARAAISPIQQAAAPAILGARVLADISPNAPQSLMQGTYNLAGSVAKLPALLYAPQNAIAENIPALSGLRVDTSKILNNPVAKWYEEGAKSWSYVDKKWGNEPPEKILERGNPNEIAEYIGHQVLINAPQQVATIAGGLYPKIGNAMLYGLGAVSGVEEYKEAKEKHNASDTAALFDSTINGLVEIVGEKTGTMGNIEKYTAAIKNAVGAKNMRDFYKKVAQTVFGSAGRGFVEESGVSLAQDYARKATGVDENAMRGAGARSLVSGLTGMVSEGVMTAPSVIGAGVERANLENVNNNWETIGIDSETGKPILKRKTAEPATQQNQPIPKMTDADNRQAIDTQTSYLEQEKARAESSGDVDTATELQNQIDALKVNNPPIEGNRYKSRSGIINEIRIQRARQEEERQRKLEEYTKGIDAKIAKEESDKRLAEMAATAERQAAAAKAIKERGRTELDDADINLLESLANNNAISEELAKIGVSVPTIQSKSTGNKSYKGMRLSDKVIAIKINDDLMGESYGYAAIDTNKPDLGIGEHINKRRERYYSGMTEEQKNKFWERSNQLLSQMPNVPINDVAVATSEGVSLRNLSKSPAVPSNSTQPSSDSASRLAGQIISPSPATTSSLATNELMSTVTSRKEIPATQSIDTKTQSVKGKLNPYLPKNKGYLNRIKTDIAENLRRGRVYAIKDDEGAIAGWTGEKSSIPEWMSNAYEYGNANHIVKAIDNVLAGKPISARMREILPEIIGAMRDINLREIQNQKFRKRGTGNIPKYRSESQEEMFDVPKENINARFERYIKEAMQSGMKRAQAVKYARERMTKEDSSKDVKASEPQAKQQGFAVDGVQGFGTTERGQGEMKFRTTYDEARKYKTANEFIESIESNPNYSYRFSRSAAGANDVPWQMFADDITKVESSYGPNLFVSEVRDAVNSADLVKPIAKALEKHPEIIDEYATTAQELAEGASPIDIVNSAELWDAADIVQVIWDEILEPRNITKVKTPDGLIVFDSDQVYSKSQLTDIWNKAHGGGEQKLRVEGMYSKLNRVIDSKMPNAATADQVRGLIKDVKSEERKWSGIDEFLKDKQKVTKQELAEFLKGNEIEIKEESKGYKTKAKEDYRKDFVFSDDSGNYYMKAVDDTDAARQVVENIGLDNFTDQDGNEMSMEDAMDEVSDKISQIDDIQNFISEYGKFTANWADVDAEIQTKYSQYQEPGGKNYREVLFTLPGKTTQFDIKPKGSGFVVYNKETGELVSHVLSENVARDMAENQNRFSKEVGRGETIFKSTHWNEPNVIAHTRLNDRTTKDGKKVLFVEEIQSDWARVGRDKGFSDEFPQNVLDSAIKGGMTKEQATNDIKHLMQEPLDKPERPTIQQWERLHNSTKGSGIDLNKVFHDRKDSGVPSAPFLKNWQEFVIKKILLKAAQEGYDGVSFISGEQTADRYDLAKQVDTVMYAKRSDGTYDLKVVKTRGSNPIEIGKGIATNKLSEYVGKEVAQRITEGVGEDVRHTPYTRLTGLDLKVGGEWATSLYNKQVPNILNDLAKKFGVKTEAMKIDGKEQLGIIFNDEMRESVKTEGFPMFRKGEKPTKKLPLTDRNRILGTVRKLFGNKIAVRFAKNIETNIDALGAYMDGMLTIVEGKGNPTDTALHESFHAFVDKFMSDEEYNAMMDAAEEKYKTYDEATLKRLVEEYNLTRAYKDGGADAVLEEIVAEGFVEYANSRAKGDVVPETMWGKLTQWFRKILARMKVFNNNLSDSIEKAYSSLYEGEAINREERYTSRPMAARQMRDQTQTEAFNKWFGDSKVVDENGKPLVVYHGTNDSFNKVVMKKGAQGIFWFTSNKKSIRDGTSGAQGIKNIMELYAKIKNPAGWDEYDKYGLAELKSMGYDGAILKNEDGSFDGFVFSPTQIKSAAGNIGTFDPKISDIRYRTEKEKSAYDINRELRRPSITGAAKEAGYYAGETAKQFLKGVDVALGMLSTRLENASPVLFRRLRKYAFDYRQAIKKDLDIAEPYLRDVKQMNKDDKADYDLAKKNGDIRKISQLNDKYKIKDNYFAVRAMLNAIHARARSVGFEIGYRPNYFPRIVKDPQRFLQYVKGLEGWSEIERLLKIKEEELQASEGKARLLSDEEKAYLVNNLIRGFNLNKVTLSETGNMKNRIVDEVTPAMNNFYYDTDAALMMYVTGVNEAIEARKFFGKGNKDLGFDNIESSIGNFIQKEVSEGRLPSDKQDEVVDILRARFNKRKQTPLVGLYRDISYIDSMGNITSAITQIGDYGFSLYRGGAFRTGVELGKALIGKSDVTREDLGIKNIAEEFGDPRTSAKAVSKVFQLIGLEKMDALGKLTYINTVLSKYRSEARNGVSTEYRERIDRIMGEQADETLEDLKSGVISPNVKELLFSEILDVQPVDRMEMSQVYNNHPNARLLYMLKSYTLKQMDVYRRESISKMNSNKLSDKTEGLKRLIRLSVALMLANAAADEIKDWMLGRKTSITDRTIDNILRLVGVSKWTAYEAREKGIMTAVYRMVLPPAKLIDGVTRDLIERAAAAREGREPKKLISTASIPFFGKFYYWWFGKGRQQLDNKKSEQQGLRELIFGKSKMPIKNTPAKSVYDKSLAELFQ